MFVYIYLQSKLVGKNNDNKNDIELIIDNLRDMNGPNLIAKTMNTFF